jgi:lysozyme
MGVKSALDRMFASSKAPEEQRPATPKAGTLAAIVGIAAATALFTLTPEEESGRKVDVTIAEDGTATIRHVAGKQYLRAYLDIAGVATACDGITPGVRMGQSYTEAQCTAMLEQQLVIHATGVMRCTPAFDRARHPNQIVAATLLAYNIGVGGYCGSTVARRFNTGNFRGACDAFLMWNKARVNGVLRPVAGLTRRRERERAICLRELV